ncbi:unnamed protein product [Cuscuta campestris]|uniref:CCHC-type domain-containing protein n=1 Tax=Cuscuta campestris TaxID=132261 RepID=A0A484L021_9ASTE|nr:unnamed protein product [Cuscuta campestris]
MTPSNAPGNVSKGNRQEPGSNKGDEKNDKKREGSPAQSTPNLEVICTDGKTDPKERNTLEEEGGVEAKQRQNPYTFAEVVAGIADQDTNLQFIPAIECVVFCRQILPWSLIGKPIKRDKATARKTKYAFARIQIEVKVHQHFPKDIVFIDDEGRAITQKIDCICSNCKKLGHLQDNCRKKDTKKQEDKQKRVVWRPKGNKDVQIDDEGPGKTDQPQKEKGTESPPDEEGFTVVSEKKVSKRILMNIEEGDFMSKLQKLLEKASYEGHYPFLK